MLKKFLSLSLVLFFIPFSLAAENPSSSLATYLQSWQSWQANFQQMVKSEGRVIQKTSGTLQLKKPHQFRWQTTKPKQLIVANGDKIWIYDEALEQVTIKPFKQSIHNTPAMLLVGDIANLDRDYKISLEKDTYILIPKKKDDLFSKIEFMISNAQLKQIRFFDHLDQTTIINFSSVKKNPPLDNKLFQFIPPKGVDVVN